MTSPIPHRPLNLAEQQFMVVVRENKDLGYGRMMQMISGRWRDEVGDGAFVFNETYAGLDRKIKRCKQEGHDSFPGHDYDWCDRCGARLEKPPK